MKEILIDTLKITIAFAWVMWGGMICMAPFTIGGVGNHPAEWENTVAICLLISAPFYMAISKKYMDKIPFK